MFLPKSVRSETPRQSTHSETARFQARCKSQREQFTFGFWLKLDHCNFSSNNLHFVLMNRYRWTTSRFTNPSGRNTITDKPVFEVQHDVFRWMSFAFFCNAVEDICMCIDLSFSRRCSLSQTEMAMNVFLLFIFVTCLHWKLSSAHMRWQKENFCIRRSCSFQIYRSYWSVFNILKPKAFKV